MASIESAVVRVVVNVSESLSDRLAAKAEPQPIDFSVPEAEPLLRNLGKDAEKLLRYLDSPDFAAVATQCRVRSWLGTHTEEQVRQGLRLARLPERFLDSATQVVRQVLTLACDEVAPLFHEPSNRIDRHDIADAAVTNSRMLTGLKSLTRFHNFAAKLRSQVVALHNSIRLPHIGVSRAVRYDRLYVQPGIESPDQVRLRLGAPGDRTVILGDPGAGKSTFAAKFAHDIAADGSGRVPFLLVLRELTDTFGEGGHELLHYLEMVCQAPYNVKPPPDAVDYLLRTGRAVVVLDGLDEVVQTDLRRRVVMLVEGFAHLYPLVPVLVTARRVGYEEAPLSSDQFTTAHIREFTEKQVKTYVRQWFLLDEATSPVERKRLTDSFIEDSEQIVELRSNPLLLALLCAMYSSDRYLPRNLAQVYERCALMLFEQWDAKRGVPLPLKFHGRLRGAVQHLAWKMFTAPESGKAQSRTRIVNTLTRYLEDKLDDPDESMATAEQFLTFCTGRAWILTDVGATDTEPQFGFTHRTFLEYFAAEHLVRTHRTASDLWTALRPNISQWEVVAQIALQLYDRNVEDGADELLSEALAHDGLDFAARSLHHVHPNTRTIRAITEQALHRSVHFPVMKRTGMGLCGTPQVDAPLENCMHECLAANLPTIEQTVISRLEKLLEDGEAGAIFVLDRMATVGPHPENPRWGHILRELSTRNALLVAEQAKTSPWGARLLGYKNVGSLCQLVERFGVRVLYLNHGYSNVTYSCPAFQYLQRDAMLTSDELAGLLAETIAERPTPWATANEFGDASTLLDKMPDHTDSLSLMLSLPFLELHSGNRHGFQPSPTGTRLIRGRRRPNVQEATLQWIAQTGFRFSVREFLAKWVRGEISVTAPDPEPQPPPPAPH